MGKLHNLRVVQFPQSKMKTSILENALNDGEGIE